MRLYQNIWLNRLLFLLSFVFLSSFEVKVRIFSSQEVKKILIYSNCSIIKGEKHNRDLSIDTHNGMIRLFADKKVYYGKDFLIKFCNNEFKIKISNKERNYKGSLYVYLSKASKMVVVNNVDLEDYVLSVVEDETSSIKNIEAIKANAVAARSYVLAAYKTRHGGEDYHFCDLTHCQLYRGVKKFRSSVVKAVKETNGYIITYKGNPIWAMYHSVCGGRTEDAFLLWGYDTMPYLKSVSDKIDGVALCKTGWGYRWRTKISKKRMKDFLLSYHLIDKNEKVVDIKISSFTLSGRVNTITFITDKKSFDMRGVDFYHLIGRKISWLAIKSTWFVISSDKKYYIFDGQGYGHGVGMCQKGADKMAELGYSWQDIIHYYYKNVDIVKL